MKRSPLKRKTRLKPRRETARRSTRIVDTDYLNFLRGSVCAVAQKLLHGRDCAGVTEPDHERHGVGGGRRADDERAYPICSKHHGEIHALNGFAKGWRKEQLRAFRVEQIDLAHRAYAAYLACLSTHILLRIASDATTSRTAPQTGPGAGWAPPPPRP